MPETQFDKSLKKIEYLFRWSGVNLESSKKSRNENIKITLYYFIFSIIWVDIDMGGSLWWIIKHAGHGASFKEVTYVVPCVVYAILCNVKSILFLIYGKHVNEVISILREAEKNSNRERDPGKDEIVHNETKFLNLVLKILNSYNYVSMTCFSLMPLVYTALNYYNTNEVKFMLPVIAEYPFDPYDIKYYPFVYLKQLWTNVIGFFQLVGIDFFFYVCTSYIRLQFKILQYDIEKSITGPRNGYRNQNQEEFHPEIVHLVKRHQQLLHCVNLVEIIYSKSTLFHFSSSSLLICICGFNIMTIDDIPYIISFICFLIVSLYQIFFLCLFGDLLMTSSTEVCDGAYNSKWYLANASVGKHFHTIQIRTQRSCNLTAYGFANVNLGAFTKILSTAWSYFALLQRLYGSPRG